MKKLTLIAFACATTIFANTYNSSPALHYRALSSHRDFAVRSSASQTDSSRDTSLIRRVETDSVPPKDKQESKEGAKETGKDKGRTPANTEHFDGTAQDKFCQPYLLKNGPPIPANLKCDFAYDVNRPESTIEKFKELGIPVSGVQLYHHGFNADPRYDNGDIATFSCNCDAGGNPKYSALIESWSGDVSKYDLKRGEAPYVPLPLFAHNAEKWNRIYVVTACAIAAVTPEFWKQVQFSCGYYNLSRVTKDNIKVVSDQNVEANNYALSGGTKHKMVPYPPTGIFLDPKAECKECDDYNPQTGKYDYNADNKNYTAHGHKCLNGPDEANKGECNPESKLPPFPKDIPASMPIDRFCQAWSNQKDHTNAPEPPYSVDSPRSALRKFEQLGGKLGGYREIRTPDFDDAQSACFPLPNNVAMFEACDCHQISYQKRVQLMSNRKLSKHKRADNTTRKEPTTSSDEPEYIALAVLGKDLCWNEHYYAAGCAIAKVSKGFYQRTKRTGAMYDFSKVTKDDVEILQNYGSTQEVLAATAVGQGQGLEAAEYPPNAKDATPSKVQKQCLSGKKIKCD